MPAVFPGGTKARESLLLGTSGTPTSGSNGERETRRRKLWGPGPGAILELRCHRPSRPFHAFFGLCRVCIPVLLSLLVSDSVSLSAPHLHRCTTPPPAGDREVAAAERLRGRGGGGGQEAGLVVIFGYLAV